MGAGMGRVVALSFSSGLCFASRERGAAEPTFKREESSKAGVFILPTHVHGCAPFLSSSQPAPAWPL